MTSVYKFANSAEELLAEARQICGIDIVDKEAQESMVVVVDSYNKEAQFTEDGAKQMRKWILRVLVNRLRMKRDFRAHPEIVDIPLKPPVFISSIQRTGSTKLQHVLSATGDFNYIKFWTMLNPSSVTGVPNENVDGRISDADGFLAWMDKASPEVRKGHSMSTYEAEEDAWIMGQSLYSPTSIAGYATCPSFLAWYGQQDKSIQFFYERDVLKYLTWQGLADVTKPWIIKTTFGSGLEESYLKAFPDANIVIPHRHPRKATPSSSHLVVLLRKAFSDQVPNMSYRFAQHAAAKKGEMEFRRKHPERPILDLAYTQIEQDAAAAVRKVYDFASLPFSDTAMANIRKWEAANPKNKHGAYKYKAEDFGFTNEDIDAAMAEYIQAYGEYLK